MGNDQIWEQFADTFQVPDDEIDLGRTALLIAAIENPELEIDHQLGLLDSLAAAASRRLGADSSPHYCINTLSDYLFEEVGFKGNDEDYYDPRNSFLNEVLSRRLGIPITLSLICIEVGKRLNIPLVGVGMPGHFLIMHREDQSLIIDPFRRGILLSEEECADSLRQVVGPNTPWKHEYLSPVSNRELIARMLRNLKGIYLNQKDYPRALRVLDRLVLIEPHTLQERRDRGVVHYQLKNFADALEDLEWYLDYNAATPDGGVQRIVAELRRQRGK